MVHLGIEGIKMQITGKVDIRAGEYPTCVDVDTLIRQDGICARAYMQSGQDCNLLIQFRKKEWQVALFVFKYDDEKPDGWWEDSELIWEFRQEV